MKIIKDCIRTVLELLVHLTLLFASLSFIALSLMLMYTVLRTGLGRM